MIKALINDKGKIYVLPLLLVSLFIYLTILAGILIIDRRFYLFVLLGLPVLPVIVFIVINRLDFAFLSYIALTPIIQALSIIHYPFGSFVITPDMVIHILLIAAIFNQFLYGYDPANRYKLSLLDKVLLSFVLLSVFALIVGSYFPIDHGKRILLYYAGIFQTVTFYFCLLYYLHRIENLTENLILAVSLTAISAAVVAFFEIRTIGLGLINLYLARQSIGFGYHNTNLFGMHAALVFPVIFYAITEPRFKNYKMLLWISFICISVLSIMTINRGTFVVILFNLFFLFAIKRNRKIIFAFFTAVAIGAVYFSSLLILYFNRFFGGGEAAGKGGIALDQSALYRLEVWEVGLKAVIHYPLGMGGIGYEYAWQKFAHDAKLFFGTPHQLFLYIAIDYGVPALIAFIVLLFVFFKNARYLYKLKSYEYSIFFYHLIAAMAGYIIHGFLTGGELSHLSGHVLPNNGYTYMLMIVLALVSYHYYKQKQTG